MNEKSSKGTITINGNNIYYEYYQHLFAKETVVLLHGFLSSTFCYRQLIPLLKNNFNVMSIDWPPFGKSGKSRRFTYSYKNLAMTVSKLLEKLQIQNITLIGHSMGGQIALNIMYYRPDLANRAILLNSSAYLKKSKFPLIFASYIPMFHLYVKRWLERSGLERNLRNVVHNHTIIDDEMTNGYLEPFLDKSIFRALAKLIRDREDDLPSQALRNITAPCLLIWGRHDKVVPLHIGKQLHNDLQNSTLIVLEEAGHLTPEERPEDVNYYINKFIKEN